MMTASFQNRLCCTAATRLATCCWPRSKLAQPGCSLSGPRGLMKLTVNRQIPVTQRQRCRLPTGLETGRDGLLPQGRGGGGEELVVEEGAAVRGVEEVVAERVLLGQFAFRQVGGVDVAQDQPGVVTPGHKLVHRPNPWFKQPVINLK